MHAVVSQLFFVWKQVCLQIEIYFKPPHTTWNYIRNCERIKFKELIHLEKVTNFHEEHINRKINHKICKEIYGTSKFRLTLLTSIKIVISYVNVVLCNRD